MAGRSLFLLLLLVPAAAVGAANFYRSNELGMQLAPVSEAASKSLQWVLEVQRSGQTEVRTLTEKGAVHTRWELTYVGGRISSESVFEKGELSTLTDYRNGHPVRQTEYSNGKPTTVRDYSYSGNLLRSISVYDGAGTLLYRDLYSEGPDGRLRRAVRETPSGKRQVIALGFSGDRLITEWLGTDGAGQLLHYSEGSLVSRQDWKGTQLLSEEAVSPSPAGSTRVTKNFRTDQVTKRTYNAAGKILSERVEKKGTTIRTVDYTYDNGKLATKLTKSPGRREEESYHYDSSGDLITSQTTVNRRLVEVTHYTGKDTYFEDLYLNGEIVLHVFYEKGKVVRQVPAESSGAPAETQGAGG